MYVMTEPGKSPAFLPEEYQVSVALQRKGFRYSEIYWHKKDLKAGIIIVAEDGTEFKLAE